MRFLIRATIALVVLAVLAGAGWAATWFVAANRMESTLAEWAREPAAGTTATLGDVTVSGFPTRLIADIARIEVKQIDDPLGLTYTAGNLRATRALTGGNVALFVRGPQSISYRADGEVRTLNVKADAFALDLRNGEDGAFAGFGLTAGNITVERPDAAPMTIRRLTLQMGMGTGPGALIPERSRFALRIDNLVLPEYRRGPLGDTIEVFSTNAQLVKGIDSLSLATALPAWRDAGGYLALVETLMKWGSLDLQGQGSGVLKLDEQLRPAGGMTVQLRDYLLTVDAFHAARRLSDEARAAVQQLVSFLSTRGAGGRIGLMMEITNGEVVVGPATLGTVGPVLPTGG